MYTYVYNIHTLICKLNVLHFWWLVFSRIVASFPILDAPFPPAKITAARALSWASNSRDWTEHQHRSFHNSTRNRHCWHFDQDQRHVKNFSAVYACSRDDQRRFARHNRLNEHSSVGVGSEKKPTSMTMELGELTTRTSMWKIEHTSLKNTTFTK